ncbi:MAG: hypothetical protein R2824_09800 [Saprospiraceae bacterium]
MKTLPPNHQPRQRPNQPLAAPQQKARLRYATKTGGIKSEVPP